MDNNGQPRDERKRNRDEQLDDLEQKLDFVNEKQNNLFDEMTNRFDRLEKMFRDVRNRLAGLQGGQRVITDNQKILEQEIMEGWNQVVADIAEVKTVSEGLAAALDNVDRVLQELRDAGPDGPTAEQVEAARVALSSAKGNIINAVTRGTAASAEPPFENSNL